MATTSNTRTLRILPPASGPTCGMCGSRNDVVLCSFAFQRVHRRIPLCAVHRQPLVDIDQETRPPASRPEDVPAAWLPPLRPGGQRTVRAAHEGARILRFPFPSTVR